MPRDGLAKRTTRPIAGGMLLSGLAVIWSILHDRRSAESALPATEPVVQSDPI